MRIRSCIGLVAAIAFVVLLQAPTVAADDPVPGLPTPPAAPAAPAAPDVAVSPSVGDGGAGIDVGVGETALQIGAGPGGVSLGVRPRGSRTAPKAPADAGVPVGTPGDRPGRSLRPGSAGSAVLFGAADGKAGAGTAGTKGSRHASPGSRRTHVGTAPRVGRKQEQAAAGQRRYLPPFFEIIERIPTAFKIGLFALALLALTVWASWVRARRRIERNAFVDPVTGIANEAAFEGLLDRELERARRYKRPLALLLLDVSEARHGRLLHDQALRAVTTAIRERVREGDIIARTGPSRFAIISPEATQASAETLSRALELRLEEMRLHVLIGAVERQATDLAGDHLLARAEAAITFREVARERPRGRPLLRAA
jgi:diguanylate cyclase (GGDEF)-like protein